MTNALDVLEILRCVLVVHVVLQHLELVFRTIVLKTASLAPTRGLELTIDYKAGSSPARRHT